MSGVEQTIAKHDGGKTPSDPAVGMPSDFTGIVRMRAAMHPDKLAFTFLKDGEVPSGSLTYGELDAKARAIARSLVEVSAPGDRALLLFQNGLEFISAFVACLYAGIVAVPVYPPHSRKEYWLRLEALASDCSARFVLGTADYLADLDRHTETLPTLRVCARRAVDLVDRETDLADGFEPRPNPLAFLQYTSGSTSMPKGVMVTQENLLHNQQMMQAGFGHDHDSVFVSWLPLFHDMGLIGNVLQSIYVGARCYIMTPAAFLQKPMRWLQAISDYRASSSFAPNFAYDLCARRGAPEELARLDLSRWSMALNGAEPIRPETLTRFSDKYAACGFDARAFYPGYGLAEATLFVSGGGRLAGITCFDADAELLDRAKLARPARADAFARRLVSSGRAWHHTSIVIVDPATSMRCADGAIGEIWVRNRSIAMGYWGRHEETDAAFKARLSDGSDDVHYLRTGDLGFLHEGHLFVTGRLKELIIVRGANYYPQDIERAVQDASPCFKQGAGAAVSIELDGEEQLVVVQEVDRTHMRKLDAETALQDARQAVLRALGVLPHAVVLIRPATLAKTSSGKIQRGITRMQFLEDTLDVIAARRWPIVADDADAAALETGDAVADLRDAAAWTRSLRAMAARHLRAHPDAVRATDTAIGLGLDSLAMAGIQHAVKSLGGPELPLARFFDNASLAEIAEYLAVGAIENGEDALPAIADDTADDTGTDGPLSDNQRQLWLLHTVAPDSAAYHVPVCLKGGFDAAPLQLAVNALSARHGILQTAYSEHEGEGRQRRLAKPPLVSLVDAADESDAEMRARIQSDCRTPHDLDNGEACRVTLYRRPDGDHYLLFGFHHIAVDLVSVQRLMTEFGQLYRAFAEGSPLPVAASGPGYRAFVAAQDRYRSHPKGVRARDFWRARLDRDLPVLQLPMDHPRPKLQTFSGTSFDFSLGPRLSERIRLASRRLGATPSTVLLTAYNVLLSRLSGQSEVVVGVPMSGRHLDGFQQTVGYFVEPAVLCVAMPPELSFAELTRSVQSDLAAAFDHQGGVLSELMARASRHSDRSVPPVLQTLYTFYPASRDGFLPFHGDLAEVPAMLADMPVSVCPLPSPGAQLDISLLVADDGGGYHARFEFNTDLFETATVRRFADRFRMLLDSVVEDPFRSVSRMALLPDEERQLSLGTWNDTAVDYGESRALHEIIDACADAHPDQIAVRCEGESLSYGELRQRSDDMARRLSARGIGVDCCVGVFMHRSLDLMVALLGVLKAGGAYVPVDPDYPPERIRHIVSAAGLSSLLTTTQLRDEVRALGMEAVCIDEPHASPADGAWQAPNVAGGNLAYVIFTSGSTGQPKGVMNTHEAIVNRLVWMQDAYRLQPGERVLQKTPFSFDVSVWEFFWPLMTGAVVVFARPGGHRDVDYLNEVMRDEHITTLHFVPSMLQVFLESDGIHLPHLRQVVCSGEELPAALVRRFFERFPNTRLHNLYGPTEAAVDVSQWPCSPDDTRARIPIGHPISNTRLYILDAEMQPLPVGVPGELYIGGVGLARGYLARPDLTAERFVPDPWSGRPGERLYRSGDVARFRADGAIEYLGRIDHQVKLRGFRIELGEIEAALTQLPGVHEAVVVVRGEGAAKALLAYVVGEALEASSLKAGLESRLPGYMVPSALMVLDALPLTPNGKVDRQGLPAIELVRDERTQLVPQTPRERAVAAVWCEVLGLDAVGVGENFFELGGHSLLAAKLVAKLRGNHGLVLRVRDVFEAPTVAAQAQRAQRDADTELALLPVVRGVDEPLSFAQQRLWFLTQLEGANATYNMPHAVRLVGALDVAALRASVTGLVARHEVLRTVYGYRDGQPRQQVRAADAFEMGWEDWRDHDPATREEALLARAHADATRAFALESDLPLRVSLLQLGEQEHVMLLCLHHIAGDGWSVEVLWRELEEGYRAALSGRPAPAAPAVQYIDYAHWQREWLAAPRQEVQLGYWRERLAGMAPLLELPTDRPRPAVQRYVGSSVAVSVPAELLPAIRQVSHAEQASVFMTLLAVFQVVLSKYSGQEDIAVGSPVANRPREELGGSIGFFANTLVLRSRVRSTQTFRTLLHEVREATLAAYEHQDVPFEQLVEALQPARSLSHSPLFQVMFNLQHGGAETIDLPGIEAQVLSTGSDVAKFDLTLTLQDRSGRLDGTLEYNSDLFDAVSVERLWRHYVVALSQVLAEQDRTLGGLALLTEEECEQHAAWNRTESRYPEACVHALFEAQAAATPDAVAVVWEGGGAGRGELSYGELNARANRLAHVLRAEGVTAETTVGVCLPRSPELIVALLAILKAGGAYVPLDPNYPIARLKHIAMQASLRIAIGYVDANVDGHVDGHVDGSREDVLAELGLHWVSPQAGDPADSADLPATALPDQLAYVMFTSGSTGLPKGILTTHRAIVRLLIGTDYAQLDAAQRILHAAPLAFDASTFEIWAPLLHGGACVLYPDQVPTGADLRAFIGRHRVGTAWLTSSLFNHLVDEDLKCIDGLQQLLVGGDVVSIDHVRRVYEALPDIRIINGYGPTESTTFAACFPIPRDSVADGSASIPIGHPISNTRLYILDAEMQPLPVGVPGELYIGGVGLARGYLARPDLTAERFVPDPWSGRPGERLYRSGDVARFRADGAIEYLGRIDHQVKLRGFRIELGEIEAALTQLPGVHEAVVVVRGEGAAKALLAYVVGEALEASSLKAGLESRLPGYMVPSALMVLDALPLTPNGKVDRQGLPAIELVRDERTQLVPQTPRERAVAAVWCEVLGLDAVGVGENFFELGGHSLLAAKLVAKLRGNHGLVLRVRDVFEAPTVAAQAQRAQRDADTELALLPVVRGVDEPLSFAQQRLWFLTQLEGANATYNMPHAVRLVGALDVAALRASVTGLVARHEVLRTVYGYRDGQPRQQVRAADAFEMGWEDWRDHDPATREEALLARAHADATRAFALESDLPLRVSLLQLGEQEHVMLLCLHHIAGDGWSVEVLWRELEEGYRAALSGRPAPAAPAVQYIDYAHWQREWLAAPRQEVQLGYWRERLAGMAPLLELPTDRPRPAVQRYVGSSVAVSVPAELLPAIRQVSHAEQASVFMTLLAVFQVVLSKYSGQEDIAVGSPVANRPREELGGSIGFFANTLVLRSRVRSTQTFRTLLHEVREATLAAYEHQDVPFEQLVEALQPARSLSHSPLFQVMFNLQHGGAETIDLPGIEAQVLSTGSDVAKFDLTLTLQDRSGRLDGTLEYNSDLFDAVSVERLWRHYVVALSQVLAEQDRTLGGLALLTEEECEQHAAWNRTESRYPEACVHALFEAQAAATPDAVAVVWEGGGAGRGELSYGELNARANRLAHVLRAEGVTAETTVGVCLPRSPELIVALLAILKAGGAYVPLDPNYPIARLAHILDNATPRVVVTDVDGRDRLATSLPQGTRSLLPDACRAELARASDRDPAPLALPAHLAYVIYTSGSTGRPKGVAITHANAVAMLAWGERTFAADALRYTLASTSICFDLSVFELFLPLSTGNTVVLVRDALALIEQPPRWPVSLVNTVPSAMEALLAADGLPSTVRVVNLAGEALSRSLVDKLHARAHVEAVYNLYGPSEDTTYSTGCRVESDSGDAPSIGRPIDNTRAFVLDADMMPVPVGVKGELYLAGAGLSRGYLHQPDLTAERYLPNPFANTPGERLYRTGDIVRHLPDGRLAYMGRADHQVKLRGFRIELGEIESVLVSCPGVREAVALVRRIGDGVETLVAFLHAEDGVQTSGDAVRLAMVGLLPDYMIPSRLIFLDAMPLTTNGKIDRKALHALPLDAVDADASEPPVGETESRLAALWRDVLGIEHVGRNDDFFAAGGNSLLATALNARILGAFAVRTTVRDVFLHPRLAELAECIDNLHWMAAPSAGEAARGHREVPDEFEVGVL